MKEFDYVPQAKEGDKQSDWKGNIRLKVLKQSEKISLLKEVGIVLTADGEADLSKCDMETIGSLTDKIGTFVSKVEVEHKKSKTKFKVFEDLEYSPEGQELIGEIRNVVLGGISLGNASRPL